MPPIAAPEEDQRRDPGIQPEQNNAEAPANTDQAEAHTNDPVNAGSNSSGGGNQLAGSGKGVVSFAGRNRKKLIGGGAAAGGLIGLIFLLSPLLAVFKLEHLYQNVEGKEFGKIQAEMDQRLGVYMRKYIEIRAYPGGSVAYYRNYRVPNNSLFKSWYQTLRTSSFEKDLLQNDGIAFVNEKGTRRLVKITFPDGTNVDTNLTKGGLTEGVLDSNLQTEVFSTSKAARVAISDAVQSETHWWQFMKRSHLRHWMEASLGITKWHIFEGTTTKVAQALRSRYSQYVLAPIYDHIGTWVDALLSSKPDGVSDNLDNPANQGAIPSAGGSTTGDQVASAAEEAGAAVGTSAGDAVIPEIGKGALGGPSTIFGALFGEKLASIFGGGPATIMQLFSSVISAVHTNAIGKIIKARNEVQYAAEFAAFAVTVDNLKAGVNTSGAEVNGVMQKFNGVENSAGYSHVFGTGCNSSAVGAACTIPANESLNPGASNVSASFDASALGKVAIAANGVYAHTLGEVNNVFGAIIGPILNGLISGIKDITGLDINHFISGGVSKVFDLFFGPVLDGSETGAKLFNAIDIGGDVTANSFSQSVGAHTITTAQANTWQLAFEQSQQQAEAQTSLTTQLASLNDPSSVLSRLTDLLPNNISGLGISMGNYFGTLMANPLGMLGSSFSHVIYGISGQSQAATGADPYGVTQFGFTNAELQVDPLSPSLSPTACATEITNFQAAQSQSDTTAASASSLCLFDQAVMQSSMAAFTPPSSNAGGISSAATNPITGGLLP